MWKKILRNGHRYVLWAVLSVVFWAWIVSRVTDARPQNKVVVYADLDLMDGRALSLQFDERLPDGIKYVEFDRFDDMIFSPTSVLTGDLYLIPQSKIHDYFASFAPIDRTLFPGASFFEQGGTAYGVCVYDEEAGVKLGGDRIAYPPGERCYLFFNKDSKHVGLNEAAYDDAASAVAAIFIDLK